MYIHITHTYTNIYIYMSFTHELSAAKRLKSLIHQHLEGSKESFQSLAEALGSNLWASFVERALVWQREERLKKGKLLLITSRSTEGVSRSRIDEVVSILLEDPDWVQEFSLLSRQCSRWVARCLDASRTSSSAGV